MTKKPEQHDGRAGKSESSRPGRRGQDKRDESNRRRDERRKDEHVTMQALFSAYGFAEERLPDDRRENDPRRVEDD